MTNKSSSQLQHLADELRRQAVETGSYGEGTFQEAERLFGLSKTTAEEALAVSSNKNIHDDEDEVRAIYELLIEILINWSEANMLVERYERSRTFIEAAAEWQEKLAALVGPSDDDSTFWLVDIYRCFSITDFYLHGRSWKKWEEKGMETLQGMSDHAKTRERHRYLKSIFLTFCAMSDELENEKCLEMDRASIDLITELVNNFPDSRRYKGQLTIAYRLGCFNKINQGNHDEALAMADTSILTAVALTEQYPKAPISWDRLVRTYRARMSVMEATTKDYKKECSELLLKQIGIRERVAELLPQFADNLRYLSDLWQDIVNETMLRKDKNGELSATDRQRVLDAAEEALKWSQKAVKLSQECEYKEERTRFHSLHMYVICLLSNAKVHWEVTKDYETALGLFSQYRDEFLTHIMEHDWTKERQSYVEDFCRAMELASEVAVKAEKRELAMSYLHAAVEWGKQRFQDRNRRQICVTHISTLADFYIEDDKLDEAIKLLHLALEIIEPLYAKFPWHFYIAESFGNANFKLAKLHKTKAEREEEWYHLREYLQQKAILHGIEFSEWSDVSFASPYVQRYSLSPSKRCSLHCENQYLTARQALRKADLKKLWERCDELPSCKKFVVRCYFWRAQVHQPFSVYLTSAIPGKDPLEDQARLLHEDHCGTIPEDVRDAIRKLRDLALKNNVNFQELCVYALNAAIEENENENEGEDDDDTDESDQEAEETS